MYNAWIGEECTQVSVRKPEVKRPLRRPRPRWEDIVTDLLKALPGNSSVNTNTGNNKRETVFYTVRAGPTHGAIGNLLPGNEAVNMHHNNRTVFSIRGSC
jgi:hypothetical protein